MKIIQIGAKVGLGEGIGRGNAGDTAIGAAFNHLFEKEFPASNVSFMNCRKIFTHEDIKSINDADVLFVSGGGLFLYDTFLNNVSDWQWGISTDLLEKIKIPIIVYALGYNKFRKQRNFNNLFNKTVNTLVKKSIFFSLRNSGSCKAIKKHIDKKFFDKIYLNFCPTMLLNEQFGFSSSFNNNSVAFVIGGDRINNRHENLEKFVYEIKSFVGYLNKKGIETTLINHQNDTWIQKYVNFDRLVDLFGKDSKQIYETYSKIDVVVADRGHGLMIPFSCGCKILSPVSHDKLQWFLNDMNLSEFGIVENDEKLATKLIEKFEKLSRLDWKEIHRERMNFVKDTNNTNINLIKEKLSKFKGN